VPDLAAPATAANSLLSVHALSEDARVANLGVWHGHRGLGRADEPQILAAASQQPGELGPIPAVLGRPDHQLDHPGRQHSVGALGDCAWTRQPQRPRRAAMPARAARSQRAVDRLPHLARQPRAAAHAGHLGAAGRRQPRACGAGEAVGLFRLPPSANGRVFGGHQVVRVRDAPSEGAQLL